METEVIRNDLKSHILHCPQNCRETGKYADLDSFVSDAQMTVERAWFDVFRKSVKEQIASHSQNEDVGKNTRHLFCCFIGRGLNRNATDWTESVRHKLANIYWKYFDLPNYAHFSLFYVHFPWSSFELSFIPEYCLWSNSCDT